MAGTLSGERGDVSDTAVEDWKSKLPVVCDGYAPKDIFNMDKTRLFYRDTTKATLKVKGDECAGGKCSKERLTVALYASMTGEKCVPLVIGKCKKPRCFKNITPESLPVTYPNNKKAWMNTRLFEWWLQRFNRKMRRQGRKVLLFVDNVPSHPATELRNVKLVFLPANTTSKLQPMDQGIIQTMKLKYRKRQLQHVISAMKKDTSKCGSQLLKGINILQAIYWVHNAWKHVEAFTIQKCFAKCGFKDSEVAISAASDVNTDDDLPLVILAKLKQLFNCTFQELADSDASVPTCEEGSLNWTRPTSELLKNLEPSQSSDDVSSDEESVDTTTVCSLSEAEQYV